MADSIGSNVRALRVQAGMTQEELASRLHVTRQAVSNYGRGRTHPDIDQLTELATVFHVDLETLIRGPVPVGNRRKAFRLAGSVLLALIVLLFLFVIFLDDRHAARKGAEFPWIYWLKTAVLLPLTAAGIAGCLSSLFLHAGVAKLNIGRSPLRAAAVILTVVFLLLLLMNVSDLLLAMAVILTCPVWYADICVSVFLFFVRYPVPLYLISILAGAATGTWFVLRRLDI